MEKDAPKEFWINPQGIPDDIHGYCFDAYEIPRQKTVHVIEYYAYKDLKDQTPRLNQLEDVLASTVLDEDLHEKLKQMYDYNVLLCVRIEKLKQALALVSSIGKNALDPNNDI